MSTENPSSEDVNTTDVADTSSDIDKLREVERNKTIALKEERDRRQALETELSEYKKKELEETEKEKKKKGQYEELLTEKEKLITELSEKANSWDLFQTQQTERQQTELADLLEKTPKDLIEKNQDILEELSNEKKIKFLSNLTVKNDFNPESQKGEKIDVNSEYEKAKKDGNISEMLRLSKLKT